MGQDSSGAPGSFLVEELDLTWVKLRVHMSQLKIRRPLRRLIFSCHNLTLRRPNKQIKRSIPIQHERDVRLKTSPQCTCYVYSKWLNL